MIWSKREFEREVRRQLIELRSLRKRVPPTVDLLERIVPEEVRARPTPGAEESLDELLLRSAQALGVGTAESLIDYFRVPLRPARVRLETLVQEGRLVACEIEGVARDP